MLRFNNAKLFWLILSATILLGTAACDRVGVAPDDLDVTPTAAPTSTPTPAPTAAPTEVSQASTGSAENVVSSSDFEGLLAAIQAEIPQQIQAGGTVLRYKETADSAGPGGPRPLPNTPNGMGFKVTYKDSGGGESELSYAVFDTPEDATAFFEFIRGIRQVLEHGEENNLFPSPNLFGISGRGGSTTIIQIDNFFIEATVQSSSNTGDNPLIPLTRAALEIFNNGIATATTPDEKAARLEAVTAAVPDEIAIGDITWRLAGNVQSVEDGYDKGLAVSANYELVDGSQATVSFVIFNTSADMTAAYATELTEPRSAQVSINLRTGSENADLPSPNQVASGEIRGSSALIQVPDFAFIAIDLTTTSADDLLTPFAEEAVKALQAGLDAYDASKQ